MFRRHRTHRDFSDEIEAHLALEADRLVAAGMAPDAARDAARRAFGNVTRAKERFYETSRWTLLEQFVHDLRYAARVLRQSPVFLATTVLTLAVGIGVVTVAFTVFNTYVLQPYPVRDPHGLHQIAWRARDDGGQGFRWRDYEDVRGRSDLFSEVIGESTRFVSSNGRPALAALVSDNYFEALGPGILLGRWFGPADAGRGEPLVLGYQAWTRLYGRDPAAIGGEFDVNGRPFVIIGILRDEFLGLSDAPADFWIPFRTYDATTNRAVTGEDQPRTVEIVARLRPGVSVVQAETALTPFMRTIVERRSDARAEVRPQPSPNPLSLELLVILAPVFAAFALVLVTACANVSNVMLARAIARHREIAVRLSLGAARGRIVRQLLTEGLLIAVLAGLAGLALAAWTVRAGTVLFLGTLPPTAAALIRVAPISIDHRVFAFALCVAAAATLVFALLPALQASRLSLTDTLRGHAGGAGRGSRLRSALVVAQVAVSIVLVIVAVTLARNGASVGSIDVGYETRGITSINVRGNYERLIRKLAPVLAANPRVAEVAATSGNPLFERQRHVAAAPGTSPVSSGTRYTFVSPEYFSLLGIPIASGRGFRPEEARSSEPVAIVSARTANAFWPGQDPIGQTIRIDRPEGRPVDDLSGYLQLTVIGTAPDVVSGMLIDGQDAGHIYLPISSDSPRTSALLIKGRTGLVEAEVLQQLFREVADDPQVFEAISLEEMKAVQMYPLHAASWVGMALGILALGLSVSGLYGVLSYTLSQRTKEIGIRMALGATASAVVALVMRQCTRLAGVGAIIGLAIACAAMQALNAAIQFETVSMLDAVAFAGGLALVLAATALAAFHPAHRATRINPSETLRTDA